MSNRRTGVILGIVVVGAVAVGAYHLRQRPSAQADEGEPIVQTAVVTRGDLSLSADGSGELIPGAEFELAFPTHGIVTELWVDVGDKVQPGDLLARVDDDEAQKALLSAQLQLSKAQLDLASAEDKLLSVQEGPSEADLLAAQAALASAQESYDQLLSGPDPDQLEKAQLSLDSAKNSLWSAQLNRDAACGRPEGNCDSAQVSVLNAEISVQRAEMDLAELLEPATEVDLSQALAQVAQSQEALGELSSSPSDDDIASAEGGLEQARLNLTQAELALEQAQDDMEQTTLVAPISGTVMAVNAEIGDEVGTATTILLADMASPQIRFWVEEADLNSVAPRNAVNIVFEAFPDYTFSGQIESVDPALVTVGGTPAVEVMASIDLGRNPITLLSGMNAEVEVIAAEAQNALLVPVQALRELGPNQYAVFVVSADDEMELRPVEVGLQDFVNAEILSGLQEGEVVRTGTTSGGSSTSAEAEMGPGAPGIPGFMLGGR
jgi:HlyD family secretion protein